MIWNSWAEFFAMGGYGLYVWGSTAAVAVCMLAEIAGLRMRRAAALEQVRMAQKGGNKMGKSGAKGSGAGGVK